MSDPALPPELAALAARHGLDEDERRLLARHVAPGALTLPEGSWDTVLLSLHPGPVADAAAELLPEEDAFDDLGLIGVGGMGEVRRVRDRTLNRTMALKVLRPELASDAETLARFIEEAQISAQLEHPGLVPVHGLGRLADGRLYFTMKEVRGRTLREVFDALHRGEGGWTRSRVLDLFRKACEAVAFAHSRGVMHRDIKPENIMVGDFGEVLVLDWGLAKVVGGEVRTVRHEADTTLPPLATRQGVVAGTPAYMAPEQAAGMVHRLGPHSDVYALGSVLYHLLAGHPPFAGLAAADIVARVASLEPPAPLPPSVPEELRALVARAMEGDPSRRLPRADALVEPLLAFLDGVHRRERALDAMREATALLPRIQALRDESRRVEARARATLARIPSYAPAEDKHAAWALEDAARALAVEAEALGFSRLRRLGDALMHDPELPEAHAALAAHHHARCLAAEAANDLASLAKHEAALREHDRAGRHAAWLEGQAHLSLRTDPAGARVRAHPFVEVHRRMVPGEPVDLGPTPLVERPLPAGSWLLVVEAPGFAPMRYPVLLRRDERWDRAGVVPMAPEGLLGPDDLWIPPGPGRVGGDPEAFRALPGEEVFVEGFILRRHPVTNAEYLAFLDDLVAQGREAEALRHAPRERPGTRGEEGALIPRRLPDGRFELGPDAEGDVWAPDWPVLLVGWRSARAYAAWLAARTGQPWRLPCELEWEKAARGADGRFYPWGNHLDPSWCNMQFSRPGRALVAGVGAFPGDESVYGVRGLGGNARDWCMDLMRDEGPPRPGGHVDPLLDDHDEAGEALRVFRGGSWGDVGRCRSAVRYCSMPEGRTGYTGFRVARSWPPPK